MDGYAVVASDGEGVLEVGGIFLCRIWVVQPPGPAGYEFRVMQKQ